MSKTILYSIAFIALGLGSGSLGPTLPALAAQTHVEMKQISNLFIARSFGTMLGSWLIGRFYDRVSGHSLLAASLLASTTALALMPAMDLLWALLMVSILLGVASASVNVGGNTLIARIHGDRVRPFMSAMHFAFGLGGLLAPMLVAKFVNRTDGLQVTYWTIALLTLPAALLTIFTKSPSLHLHNHSAASIRLPALTLGFFVIFFFLEVGAEASLMGWIFSYAIDHGMSGKTAAHINSAFWAAFTMGRLATIWLTTQFRAISIVIANLSITLIFAMAALILPVSQLMLWVVAIGLGFSIAPVFPNTFGYAQRVLGLSGKVTGWFLVGSSAGSMFWPWMIGQFFKSQGPEVLIWVVMMNLCGALVTVGVLVGKRSQKAIESPD